MNVAAMMIVYGFPYILVIPSVWDIAMRNTSRHLNTTNIEVKSLDSIPEVASIDYLVLQSISVLDKRSQTSEERESTRVAIRRLQAMGIKIVIATGVAQEEAV